MNFGLALALLSLAAAAGNLAAYYPKMTGNRAALRPRLEQVVMTLALILAIAALTMRPGVLGVAVAILAILPSSLFLLATLTSGLPRQPSSVSLGEIAPEFQVLDSRGRPFRLSDLRGSPALLKFYRGYWCPYCVAELEQLDRYAPDFDALGVKLIAISSDRVDELGMFAKKHGWAIRLLADPDLVAHRRYNVQHRNFAPRRGPFREIAIPTTILLDADGRVLLVERASDFRVRPQADKILAKTRALLAGNENASATPEDCDVCVA